MKSMRMMLVLAVFACFSTAAFANQCSKEGKECSMRSGDDCSGGCPVTEKILKKAHFFLENADEIGLSDEQVKQITGIKVQAKKAAIQGKAGMELFMLDLMAKLHEDTVDVEGLNALIDKSAGDMTSGAKQQVQAYADLKGILSAEQMAKAKSIWKKKN